MKKNRDILYMIQGIKNIKKTKKKGVFLFLYWLCIFIIWNIGNKYLFASKIFPIEKFNYYIFNIFSVEMLIIGTMGILVLLGIPRNAKKMERALLNIKFVDNQGETPVVLSEEKDKRVFIYEFYSPRIAVDEYKKRKEKIENALNLKIIDIVTGKDMQHILLKTVKANFVLPQNITWSDMYLNSDDFKLRLGISYYGTENIDLTEIPHCLIAGSTGSGKSALLKLLLMQCLKKGADVYIADFKGISFANEWHERCNIVCEDSSFLEQLEQIMDIMAERSKLFKKVGCESYEEYNAKAKTLLKRVIVASDEIAEVLDKGNKSKKQIESYLSTIARMGRAYGIHLIVATQRPDCETMCGQIKNNIDFRICGRAEKVLSQIIIDSSEAAERISKESKGRFLTNTGIEFQAFYVEDKYFERF